jgi:hypothetical protein
MENFTVGKIRRSLQRFTDFAGDLSRADMNTFDDRLSLLMDYCKNDEVFQVIDAQLKSVNSVDFDSWYAERKATLGGMMGSGQLTFPTNLDQRLSVMYQLLSKVNAGDIDFMDFSHTFFATGDSRIDSRIYAFNEAVVEPLARELSYRFEEIEETMPENQRDTVPLANVQIIHNAQNVIQQSATGSNISQKANIEQNTELESLFSKLKKEIDEAIEDAEAKNESIEIAESAQTLVNVESPKPVAAKALLNTLPPLGNISSIVSAILSAIAILG